MRKSFPSRVLGLIALFVVLTSAAWWESPVADAAMRRDRAAVRALLQQGADVNAAQGDGMTALHWAASNGDAELARMLIYAGGRVDGITRNGSYTPLHLASKAGSAAVVKVLLEGRADVKAVTSSGGATALHLAAAQGNKETITALLDGGAVVDAKESAWGQTPLMWAAAFDRVSAIELLIARGADVNGLSAIEDTKARESADRAAQQARNRRVAALRAAEQPTGRGAAPAGAAGGGRAGGGQPQRSGEPATAQPSGEPGRGGQQGAATQGAAAPGNRPAADSQAARQTERALSYTDLIGNRGGLTPLLFATRQGNATAALALLKAGADINQVSGGDKTSPLLMATLNGHFDLALTLLQRGANPKLASEAGATPLYGAINVQWSAKSLYPQPTAHKQQKATYLALMEALLKAGADVNARLTKHLWFMSYNFDLLGVNTTGATTFWRAAYGTDVDAMKLLKQYGADHTIATIKPAGGRQRGDDAPAESDEVAKDPSGLPPIPAGGPGVYPLHAASGVGYGEGYAANSHRHAPDGWLPAVKYLIEELGVDVNARDHNGYNAVHHAAARGDNELIEYLVSKGADVKAVSRRGQTTADMANGPVQRVPPFLSTVALLEKLGSLNSHKCRSC
jgi:ankyrin repeat protein